MDLTSPQQNMDFAALRRDEFSALDNAPGIFLNTASVGPLPRRSAAILEECARDRRRPDRWPQERMNAILNGARELAARLIGAGADEIALMPNTTTALNVAARALPLAAGDIVVTFDREFPANIYPWLQLADRGVTLERIPVDANGWPDEARMHERLRDDRVRAVTVSLTQFSNGYTVDLDALSRATRQLGKWLVVDSIQAVGQLPVDVERTPVDFLACGAQKWLLSPWGTGFLYVRRALIAELSPTFAGWAAFRSSGDYTRLTSYDPEPWPDARKFELLTFPVQDFAAMNASIELLLGVGIAAIRDHLARLHQPIIAWAERAGAAVTSPRDARGSGILCVRPRGDVQRFHQRLAERGVQCSLREGAVRLSPAVFTTDEEIARVVALLDSLIEA